MSPIQALQARADSTCELCGSKNTLSAFAVAPHDAGSAEHSVLTCATCSSQLEAPETADGDHWRCLSGSMWSEVPAVKVVAWRMLSKLSGEDWARSLLDMLYIEDDILEWAQSGIMEESAAAVVHKDSNGALLVTGDTVTLIKDLDVKGANFTAKRGTAVRNIMIVDDNAEHIEGRVEGQRIVILTKFVRKAT
jgi:protein PhnA